MKIKAFFIILPLCALAQAQAQEHPPADISSIPSANVINDLRLYRGDGESLLPDGEKYAITLSPGETMAVLTKINNRKGIPFYSLENKRIRQVKAIYKTFKAQGSAREGGIWSPETPTFEVNRGYSFFDLEKNASLYLLVHHFHTPVSGILSLWRVNVKNGDLKKIFEVYGDTMSVYEANGTILLAARDIFFYSLALFDKKTRTVKPLYALGFGMAGSGNALNEAVWPEKVSDGPMKKMKIAGKSPSLYTDATQNEIMPVHLIKGTAVYALQSDGERTFIMYPKAYKDPVLKQFENRVWTFSWIKSKDLR